MPTTVGGLIIFAVFLTPGFLNYLQRRRRAPQRSLSPLVELATFFSSSVATNFLTLGIFCLVRLITPQHTPNLALLVVQGSTYIDPRVGYVVLWALMLLALSCMLAVVVGIWPGRIGKFVTPLIVDASAWYYLFESAPVGSSVYLGCDLSDGGYVGGYLDWYNTDIDEVADRDLVLAAPITLKVEGKTSESEFERMILSARSIIRIYVTFVEETPALAAPTPGRELAVES